MSDINEGPLARFADELDELVTRWCDKPDDDKLTGAEVVGTLQFKAFILMQQMQRQHEIDTDADFEA